MLKPVPWRELIRKLHKLGYEGPISGGKHPFMKKGRLKLRIPNPHQGDVSVDLLKRILRQGKIKEADWERI